MPESRGKFEERFFKLLTEDMSVGGGALGSGAVGKIFNPPDNINSGDNYAPGDARRPKVLGKGKVQTRSGSASKKKKDKKKRGIDRVFLTGEEDEEGMCPDACCGMPIKECKCGPDCEHCNCYEINNG